MNTFKYFPADDNSVIARALEAYADKMLDESGHQRDVNVAVADRLLARSKAATRLQRQADHAYADASRKAVKTVPKRPVEEEEEQEEGYQVLERDGIRFTLYNTARQSYVDIYHDAGELVRQLNHFDTTENLLVLVEEWTGPQIEPERNGSWDVYWEVPATRLLALIRDELLYADEILSATPPYVIDRTTIHA